MKASLAVRERGFLVFIGPMDLSRLLSRPVGIPFRGIALSSRDYIDMPRWGIGFKLLLIVRVVSAFAVLTSSALILILQTQQLIDSAQTPITHLGNAFTASLEQAMLRNEMGLHGHETTRLAAGG